MPKEVTKYLCDYCMVEFSTAENCLEHEKLHPNCLPLRTILNYTPRHKYPYDITLEFVDGAKLQYFLAEDTNTEI